MKKDFTSKLLEFELNCRAKHPTKSDGYIKNQIVKFVTNDTGCTIISVNFRAILVLKFLNDVPANITMVLVLFKLHLL